MKSKTANYQDGKRACDNFEIRLDPDELKEEGLLGKQYEVKYILQKIASMLFYGGVIIGFAVVIVMYL